MLHPTMCTHHENLVYGTDFLVYVEIWAEEPRNRNSKCACVFALGDKTLKTRAAFTKIAHLGTCCCKRTRRRGSRTPPPPRLMDVALCGPLLELGMRLPGSDEVGGRHPRWVDL